MLVEAIVLGIPAVFALTIGSTALGHVLVSLDFTQSAAMVLRDAGWRGYALAKSGDFAGAATAFGPAPVNAYNRGNALARLGRFKEALDAYDAALDADPEDEDARFNKAVVATILDEDATRPGVEKGQANATASRDRRHGGSGNQQGDTKSTGVGYTGNKEGSSSATSQGTNAVQKIGRGSAEESTGGSDQASGSAGQASGRGRKGSDIADIAAQLTVNQRRVTHAFTAQSVKPTVEWLQAVSDNPGGFLKLQIRAEQKLRLTRDSVDGD